METTGNNDTSTVGTDTELVSMVARIETFLKAALPDEKFRVRYDGVKRVSNGTAVHEARALLSGEAGEKPTEVETEFACEALSELFDTTNPLMQGIIVKDIIPAPGRNSISIRFQGIHSNSSITRT